jgi:hypothetical protein
MATDVSPMLVAALSNLSQVATDVSAVHVAPLGDDHQQQVSRNAYTCVTRHASVDGIHRPHDSQGVDMNYSLLTRAYKSTLEG